MRRGRSGISGLLAVDKPAGMTSHDVVDVCRKAFSEGRVGHAGTLDPMATGLLVVAVGPATRLLPYLTGHSKRYEARIVFGFETDTDDAEGEPTRSLPVPDEALDPFFAADFVASLIGQHEQVPPIYSAIRKHGEHAYEAARRGEEVVLEPRQISICEASLLGIGEDDAGRAYWDVVLGVSAGTYIRAIARDIGRSLDGSAHLGALRRISSGAVSIDEAVPLSSIEAMPQAGGAASGASFTAWLDPVRALSMPAVELDEKGLVDISCGRAITRAVQAGPCPMEGSSSLEDEASNGYVAMVSSDKLMAIYKEENAASGWSLKPAAVIPGGVQGCRNRTAR